MIMGMSSKCQMYGDMLFQKMGSSFKIWVSVSPMCILVATQKVDWITFIHLQDCWE